MKWHLKEALHGELCRTTSFVRAMECECGLKRRGTRGIRSSLGIKSRKRSS